MHGAGFVVVDGYCDGELYGFGGRTIAVHAAAVVRSHLLFDVGRGRVVGKAEGADRSIAGFAPAFVELQGFVGEEREAY